MQRWMENKISAHVPGKVAKLRGVIYDVPLAEIAQAVQGGKVVKSTKLQTVVSSPPV